MRKLNVSDISFSSTNNEDFGTKEGVAFPYVPAFDEIDFTSVGDSIIKQVPEFAQIKIKPPKFKVIK